MQPTESVISTTSIEGNRYLALLSRLRPLMTSVGVSFGIVALQLAQGILLARMLGPEGRGEYATAVLFAQSLLYVGLFGAIEVVCRHSADMTVSRKSLRSSALKLAFITSGVTTLGVMACNAFGLPAGKQFLLPLALLCSLSIFGHHLFLILSSIARGMGDFTTFNHWRLWAAAAFPVMLLGWSLVLPMTVTSACVLFVIASLVSALPCLFRTRDEGHPRPAPEATQMLREGRPYAVSMLATDVLERLDVLLMLWLAPLVTQGFYSAMIPVAYPLTVIPNTLGMFLFNVGARQGGGLGISRVNQVMAASIAIQTVMTIGFVIVVGPVVRFVYGAEFNDAIIFAIWLAPVAAIKGIVQGLESYIKGRGRPLAAVAGRIVAAIAMLAAIAVLFCRTGALSIAQGALVGQVVCLFAMAYIVYRDAASSVDDNLEVNSGKNPDPAE